jgi:hypothetical protein
MFNTIFDQCFYLLVILKLNQMKKSYLFIIAIALLTYSSACHKWHRQVTTIEMNTNNTFMKIQYSGHISFNGNKTAIESMSPGSYIKFKKNGEKFVAESDNRGIITYEVDDSDKTIHLSEEGKQVLAEAIKMVADNQDKQKSRQ